MCGLLLTSFLTVLLHYIVLRFGASIWLLKKLITGCGEISATGKLV